MAAYARLNMGVGVGVCGVLYPRIRDSCCILGGRGYIQRKQADSELKPLSFKHLPLVFTRHSGGPHQRDAGTHAVRLISFVSIDMTSRAPEGCAGEA